MKPTSETLQKFNYALDALIERDFMDILYHTTYWYEWSQLNSDFIDTYDMDYHDGATKACVSFDFSDEWVIKIPILDSYEAPSCDYCKIELKNYNKAIEKNCEKYFPETYFLSDFGGMCIIIQERLDCSEEVECTVISMFEENVSEWFDRSSYEDEDSYHSDVSYAAEELDDDSRIEAVFGYVPELSNFIEDYNINDLHSGNYGIDAYGNWKISDFSGF